MSKRTDLDAKLKTLEKQFGLKKASSQKDFETIYTGVYAFDYVVDGIKVVQGGHKIEMYGAESSGKTSMCLKIVKRFQELGKIAVWVTSESFHKEWASVVGVDVNKLLLDYPDSVEAATEKVLQIVHDVDLVVIDSLASLVPEAEIEKTMHEQTRGVQAKAYSQFSRKLYREMAHETTVIIGINQLREKMNIQYGDPLTTPGGRALRHLFDTRLYFKLGKPIDVGTKENKERIGTEMVVFGKKNKLGRAARKATFDFYFKDGCIDNCKSLLFAGLKYSVIGLTGKTYTFKDKRAVGRQKFIDALNENDWIAIETEVWKRLH